MLKLFSRTDYSVQLMLCHFYNRYNTTFNCLTLILRLGQKELSMHHLREIIFTFKMDIAYEVMRTETVAWNIYNCGINIGNSSH